MMVRAARSPADLASVSTWRRPPSRPNAGAGALDSEDGWACCILHCARNCGQVARPVAPAAGACFHWAGAGGHVGSGVRVGRARERGGDQKSGPGCRRKKTAHEWILEPRPVSGHDREPGRAFRRRRRDRAHEPRAGIRPRRSWPGACGNDRRDFPVAAEMSRGSRMPSFGRPGEKIEPNREAPRPDDDTGESAEEALDRLARFVEAWRPSMSPRGLPALATMDDRTPRLAEQETVDRQESEPVAVAARVRRGPPILTAVVLFLAAMAAVGAIITLGGGSNRSPGPPAVRPALHPLASAPAAHPPRDGAGLAPATEEESVQGAASSGALAPPGSSVPADEAFRGAGRLATPPEPPPPAAPGPESQGSGPTPAPPAATKDAVPADEAVIQIAEPESSPGPQPKAAISSAAPAPASRQPDEPSADPEVLRSRAAALAEAPLPPARPAGLGRPERRERAKETRAAAEGAEPSAPSPERPSETAREPLRLFGGASR
jgi:hypothetical protein